MRTNVETLEGNKVKLTVELDQQEVDEAVEQAFKKIAREVNVPGFRRGKAPRRLIESRVGIEAARAQALNDSLPDHYMKALHETETDAIASPEIKITGGETEGPVTFEAEVEIRPVPAIPGYQGLQVTVPNPVPTDEEVDAQIERTRSQFGELETVERPSQAGDFLTLDIAGSSDGEAVPGLNTTDWSYEVGSSFQALGPDFDGQVTGASAGDVREFTSVVPPNDLSVDFVVTVKAVAERKLPEVTDEWANEVSEFDTVAELRADVQRRLAEIRKVEASRAVRTGAIEALAELVDVEIPDSLVNNEMQRQIRDISYRLQAQGADLVQFLQATGQSEEAFLDQLRASSTQAVRADLGLRALAAKENLEVTDEEVDAEVVALAEQFGEKVSRVRRDLERAEQIPAVRSDIRKAKAVEWLVEHVEIVDAEGRPVDREAIQLVSGSHDHSGQGHDHEGEATA